jgi:hypothetical protein
MKLICQQTLRERYRLLHGCHVLAKGCNIVRETARHAKCILFDSPLLSSPKVLNIYRWNLVFWRIDIKNCWASIVLVLAVNSKLNFLALYPVKFLGKDETPNLRIEDVIMCCLIRAIRASGGSDILWSNGGTMIIRGKPKKFGENPAPMPFLKPRISRELTRDWNRAPAVIFQSQLPCLIYTKLKVVKAKGQVARVLN